MKNTALRIQGETYCSLGVTTFSANVQGFIKSLEISAIMSLFLLRWYRALSLRSGFAKSTIKGCIPCEAVDMVGFVYLHRFSSARKCQRTDLSQEQVPPRMRSQLVVNSNDGYRITAQD